MARPPRDYHPLAIAVVELWSRSSGYDPGDVWTWLTREAPPPPEALRDILSALYPVVRASDFGLTSAADNDTTDTVSASEIAVPRSQVRKSRAILDPDHRRHPFVKALQKKGITVVEIAKDLGYPRTTVQSWYKARKDGDARPIPRAAAVRIRDTLGVPLTAWQRITD